MDFPSKEELLAHHHNNPASIASWMGATSLGYLSVEGLQAAVSRCQPSSKDFCKACFTGHYPVPIEGVESDGPDFVNESTARAPDPSIPTNWKRLKTTDIPSEVPVTANLSLPARSLPAKPADW
jgi:hypothetical protein